MKNITLSAEAEMIRQAREKAAKERTTLNEMFRRWLARYVGNAGKDGEYTELMERLSYARSSGTFSRDELNER